MGPPPTLIIDEYDSKNSCSAPRQFDNGASEAGGRHVCSESPRTKAGLSDQPQARFAVLTHSTRDEWAAQAWLHSTLTPSNHRLHLYLII